VVGIAAALLRASAPTMKSAVDVIEMVSYAFIIAIGVRLLRVKGIALLNALRGQEISARARIAAGLIEALLYVAIIQFVAPSLIAVVNPSPVFGNIAYQLVGAACLVLLWLRGSELIAAWRTPPRTASAVGAAVTPHDHAHHEAHAHHDHDHHDHDQHGHEHHAHDHGHAQHDHDHGHGHHHHDHEDASAWGHAHAPEPEQLAGPGGWKRGLSAVVAVGLRPCSGAIIVLVFALAQGLLWAGVAATFVMGIGTAITVAAIATIAVGARSWASRLAGTKSGYGMVAMRGIEVAAAFVIIAFGALLLTGYMVSERIGV
jgi:nickel/cobalt exporter